MRASQLLLTTRRDPPSDATTLSYGLLVRAGMVRHLGDGVHVSAPLLTQVLRRVEAIVREELDRAGGQELRLPLLQPAAVLADSQPSSPGAGPLLATRDRAGTGFAVAPPGDAAVAAFLRDEVRSYRQLPLLLYHLSTALRADRDRRAELLRAREYLRLDAFTYDLDVAGMDASLRAVTAAYERILSRCGLDAVRTERGLDEAARTVSLVVLGVGDEQFAVSSDGGVWAVSAARARLDAPAVPDEAPLQEVRTPDARTMEALIAAIPDVSPQLTVKTLLYETADGALVAAVCRGDRSVDECKLAAVVGADGLDLAGDAGIRDLTGAEPGFAGPVGLPDGIRLIVDPAAAELRGFVCGANRTDTHLRDVWWGRDVRVGEVADIDRVRPGDRAADGGRIDLVTGIEVARLTTSGGAALDGIAALRVLDETGAERDVCRGSHTIDLTRLVATVVEGHGDGGGIVWPTPVAPFGVVIVQTRPGDDTQETLAGLLYGSLDAAGCRPLWDDRRERPGVKFHDADLIGAPVRLTVGRDAAAGQVEVLDRRSHEVQTLTTDDAVRLVTGWLGEAPRPRAQGSRGGPGDRTDA